MWVFKTYTMQKNIKLAIPTPCHEKWNSFAKTEQGGFCGSCQKEVIDFTGWSEDRLKAYFKKPPVNACGRFKSEQLKVYTFSEPSSSKINWLSFTLVSLLLLFSSRQTSAQTITKSKPTTEQLQPETKIGEMVVAKSDSAFVVTGKVSYAGDHNGLPGVHVTCKGTTTKTVTDADGNFTLKLNGSSSLETLVFDFVGLRTTESVVYKNEMTKLKITMDQELLVLGGLESGPWYSPRRWWWGVKHCLEINNPYRSSRVSIRRMIIQYN